MPPQDGLRLNDLGHPSRFEQSQMCRTSNDNEVFVGLVPSTAGEFNLVNEFIALDGLLYSPQSEK